MNMFSSLVDKFKEITQPTNKSEEALPGSHDCLGDDTEEDGFLLLGQTRSERLAVVGHEFDVKSVNAPPTYDQLMTPTISDIPPPFPSSDSSMTPPAPKTAVADIPFELSPRLAIIKDIRENPAYTIIADHTEFRWNLYDYDFSHEEAFLREYGTGDPDPCDIRLNSYSY